MPAPRVFGLAAVIALTATGCGSVYGSGGNTAATCRIAQDYATTAQQLVDGDPTDSVDSALQRLLTDSTKMERTAPSNLAGALRELAYVDPDSPILSERVQVLDAADTVNRYFHDKCGLEGNAQSLYTGGGGS